MTLTAGLFATSVDSAKDLWHIYLDALVTDERPQNLGRINNVFYACELESN